MKRKILPVLLNTKLQIECWTYYKMAIIQTLPNYMNWLSSHMDLFYGDMSEGLYYGNLPKLNQPEYYSDILDIEEIDLYSVSVDKIVDEIKNTINEDFYYLLYIRTNDQDSHEVFIYGYDDKERFFHSLGLENNGHFGPVKISYERLYDGYSSEIEFFKEHPEDYYRRRDFGFGYVMCRIKPNYRYISKNYAAEYFEKISREAHGGITYMNYTDAEGKSAKQNIFYTGIDCLLKIIDKSRKCYQRVDGYFGSYYESGLRRNILKLNEHRKLIYNSMKWFEQTWEINDDSLINLPEQYSDLCKEMEKTSMLFLKYQKTRDLKILKRVAERLEEQHQQEKPILIEYAQQIRKWYTDNRLKKLLNY